MRTKIIIFLLSLCTIIGVLIGIFRHDWTTLPIMDGAVLLLIIWASLMHKEEPEPLEITIMDLEVGAGFEDAKLERTSMDLIPDPGFSGTEPEKFLVRIDKCPSPYSWYGKHTCPKHHQHICVEESHLVHDYNEADYRTVNDVAGHGNKGFIHKRCASIIEN